MIDLAAAASSSSSSSSPSPSQHRLLDCRASCAGAESQESSLQLLLGSAYGRDLAAPGGAGVYATIRQMMRAFSRFPLLRQKILAPRSEDELRLAESFQVAAVAMLGRYVFEIYCLELLRYGHLSVDRLKKLHNIDCFSNPGADYAIFFEDLGYISMAEKELLLQDSKHFERVLGFLDGRNRQLARAALLARRGRTVENLVANSVPVSN